ncbi:MAG: ABC transporter substrate-binding protein [Humidesulfovibrio sp.]|nr:ABC transporter substrate-binding protein [Humidesulfovibrio sp.]
MRPPALLLCAVALSAMAFGGLTATVAQAGELASASLVLQWQPQAQFAGFYVAEAKGFYREAGVDLTLIPGGQDVVASKLLAKGRAQFATMFLATGIERRAEGLPVVDLAQLVQRSALMLITRKDSGIREPKDLDGKRVGLWDNEFQLQPRALFQRLGIHPKIISQSSTLGLFLRGGVDAASGMWYNEYHTLLASGLDPEDLRVFFYRDLGLNFPEDGIYTLENTLATNPALCRAVVTASLRGWEYAFAHPEEALGIVLGRMRAAHVPVSRAHQRFMLARMRDVMLPAKPGDPALGTLERADYEHVAQTLTAQRFIKKAPPFEQFSVGRDFLAGGAQ